MHSYGLDAHSRVLLCDPVTGYEDEDEGDGEGEEDGAEPHDVVEGGGKTVMTKSWRFFASSSDQGLLHWPVAVPRNT